MNSAGAATENPVGQATTEVRPAWGLWGGSAITLGGALLFVATLIEVPLWQEETLNPGLLAVFTVLFLGSTVAHAVAMIPLSGGRTGSDGIVGRSLVGRVALLGFGAVFLTMQTVYYTVTYALPAADDYSGVLALTTVLGVVQLALLLIGSLVIIRAGVATGAARWAFLALTVVAIITGATANTTESTEIATVALLCSTGAQIVVGLVLATTRNRAR
ncbi:hypothetical protein [Herbiconiux sp.]|uniref:hypothetical protein n=1 Tax=Herbiconiux sp. TaxID=1871186 RepID=UPI0025BD6291|nr:hypothetical protein [Herbiconiux sp.]